MSYAVAVEGLETLKDFANLSQEILKNAQFAINKTLDRTRTDSADRIRRQVAFTAQYLTPAQGRLTVARRATISDLEGAIRGRGRPTSLARFARGGVVNRAGVTVVVKPGNARFMKKAFLIKLRRGTADLDTQHNLGLAIRLAKGKTVHNKKQVVQLGQSNLYLLYGPSVDQVFRTVKDDASPEALRFLEDEFLRLMAL